MAAQIILGSRSILPARGASQTTHETAMIDHLAAFDIPVEIVNHEEPIAVLIGVHLRLEAFVIALIVDKLPNPSALQIDRLSFPTKVELGCALGALPPKAAPGLLSINKLRNRIAHNLDAALTPEDGQRLASTMPFLDLARRIPRWSTAAPSQRVAICALALQAWVGGVVYATQNPDMTKEEWAASVAARYPWPKDSGAPSGAPA